MASHSRTACCSDAVSVPLCLFVWGPCISYSDSNGALVHCFWFGVFMVGCTHQCYGVIISLMHSGVILAVHVVADGRCRSVQVRPLKLIATLLLFMTPWRLPCAGIQSHHYAECH